MLIFSFINITFNMIYFKTLLFLSLFYLCSSYKILFIYHIPSKSHHILASQLVNQIAKRGHQVTFITPVPLSNPHENVNEIVLDSIMKNSPVANISIFDMESYTTLEKIKFLSILQVTICEPLLSSEKIQNLLKSKETYDAVIMYYYLNEALLGLAHHFKAPIILFASMPLYAPESQILSHPTASAYVSNILTEHTGHMSFWQRVKNTYHDFSQMIYYNLHILPKHREMVRKYIPKEPDLYDFINSASLILVNSHVSTTEAIPVVPNMLEIGGYHIGEAKSLPIDLQTFLDESINGVIYFSMGSSIRSYDFPKEKRIEIIKTFSKLKENILWKFEEENFPELPENVKIMPWVPQSDVLAHTNVKAFISHGGLLSTMESVYHGVPIVGIPIFVDQKMNIAVAVSYRYAVEVPYRELTEEKLSHALDEVLHNPKYKNNIQKRSKIMKDRPITPSENALYWIEYVIRHQGAPHLRYPGMELNWFQRNLLDVFAFVLILMILPIFVVFIYLKRIFEKNFKRKTE